MKEGPNTASMDRSEIVRLSLGKNSADMRARHNSHKQRNHNIRERFRTRLLPWTYRLAPLIL